jgi:hypothetical protein
MKEEIANINLLTLERKPANCVFIVTSREGRENTLLGKHLEHIHCEPYYECIPGPEVWIKNNDRKDKGLVPIPILKSIITWISEVYQ